MRIVSLLPSATEIVHALGGGSDLVGRSEECDFPPAVRELPVVMHAKSWDSAAPSSEIDARVRRVRATGESLYALDVEAIAALRPDVLLTQDLCGVCSVTESEVEQACHAAGVSPEIIALTPRRLEEVWSSVETIGAAIGRRAEATRLAAELRRRSRPPRSAIRAPSVAVVEWLDPPILAGLWTPDSVAAAGGVSWHAEPGEPGVRSSWSELRDARPDLVVLSPCSFSVPRTLEELRDSPVRPVVDSVDPARGFWVADEAYFSRPGPRLADGVELVARLLEGSVDAHSPGAVRWRGGTS